MNTHAAPFPIKAEQGRPPTYMATNLWYCHDGWACSVGFVVNGEIDWDLADKLRVRYTERFPRERFYRSQHSEAAARRKLQKILTIAREILPDAPLIEND